MISNCWPLTASATFSSTAPLVNRNKAEVPGVILRPHLLNKALFDPVVGKVPYQGSYCGTDRRPKNGIKNNKPNKNPQNAPPSAPTPVMLVSCLVMGFFAPRGQVTMAPSSSWSNCCFFMSMVPRIDILYVASSYTLALGWNCSSARSFG
jgi:hypothetical protein